MTKHKEYKDPTIHDKREEAQSESSFEELADVLDVDLKRTDDIPAAENILRELDEVKLKAEENWDKFVRTKAEMANLQERAKRDITNAHRFALEKFVAEFPPILDSMEQGIQAAQGAAENAFAIREGMDMTYQMLLKSLEKFGVTQLNPLNATYDPHQHEAMAAIPAPGVAPNTIIEVIQKGYALNGRLIRPARVIVSKAEE